MEKKFWFQMIGLVLLIFLGLGVAQNPQLLAKLGIPILTPATPQASLKTIQIIGNDPNVQTPVVKARLEIEIADTPSLRTKGLGFRDNLATNSGMLFLFDEPSKNHVLWMKGMKFPLDFIWLMNNLIVDLQQNIPVATTKDDSQLPRYAPVSPVNRVLEVNSGIIQQFNIQVGDKIEFLEGTNR